MGDEGLVVLQDREIKLSCAVGALFKTLNSRPEILPYLKHSITITFVNNIENWSSEEQKAAIDLIESLHHAQSR